MTRKSLFLVGVFLLAYQVVQITSKIELTNLKCIPLDETFADFEYCRIKSVNRTFKYVSLKVKLLQVPVTNVTINISLFKRFNDYKPFLYNLTIDGCKFQASQRRNPIYSAFYGLVSHYTNMNHTCPYDHDLILDKVNTVFLNQYIGKVFPVPNGDYAIFSNWYAYGIIRADVRVYATLS